MDPTPETSTGRAGKNNKRLHTMNAPLEPTNNKAVTIN